MRRIEMNWGCLNCFKNTEAAAQFAPRTAFYPTADIKKIRGVIERAATDPKCSVKFAMWTSDATNDVLHLCQGGGYVEVVAC